MSSRLGLQIHPLAAVPRGTSPDLQARVTHAPQSCDNVGLTQGMISVRTRELAELGPLMIFVPTAAMRWFPGEAGTGRWLCRTWWPTGWQRHGGAPLNREQRAGWARLGRPPTAGAAPPGVRPPGQRAWPSAGALVAVTCQGEDLTTTSAACARAETDAGLLVCVKARGLVRFGKVRLAFGHPLIHDAVYYGASAGSAGDARCAAADLRSPRTLLTCHDR